jgi:hypothetical protein
VGVGVGVLECRVGTRMWVCGYVGIWKCGVGVKV